MTPNDIFWNKFDHLTEDQAQKVLADLVLTNTSYIQRKKKSIITVALEVALNKIYTTDEDIKRLHALLESIFNDEEYDFNDGGYWEFNF